MGRPVSSRLQCLGRLCHAGCSPFARRAPVQPPQNGASTTAALPAATAVEEADVHRPCSELPRDVPLEGLLAKEPASPALEPSAAAERPGDRSDPDGEVCGTEEELPVEAATAGIGNKPDEIAEASNWQDPRNAAIVPEGDASAARAAASGAPASGEAGDAPSGTASDSEVGSSGGSYGEEAEVWQDLAMGGQQGFEDPRGLPAWPVHNPFRDFPGVPPAGHFYEPRPLPRGLLLQWPRWPCPRFFPCCRRARGLERLEQDRSRSSRPRLWRSADASAPGLQLGVATLAGEGLGSVQVAASTTGAELRAQVAELTGVPRHEVSLVMQGAAAPLQDGEAVLRRGEESRGGPPPQVVMLRVRRRLALGGFSDGSVRLWDAGEGKLRETLRGHRLPVGGLAADWATQRALSGSLDGTIRLWDLERGTCVESLTDCHLSGVNCLEVDWTERRALAGLADGMMALWDLSEAECLTKLRRGHAGPVQCVAAGWADGVALSGSTDGALLLWNLEMGSFLELQGHRVWVSGVEVDGSCRHAISGSIDGVLRLWELRSSRCVREWRQQWNDVKCMSVNWETGQVLSGAGGGALKLWDLGSGRCIEAVPGGGGLRQDVQCLAADWRGRCALSGAVGGRLALWDLESASVSCELQADGQNTVKCLTMTGC